jgi:hypothetical protein
MDAGTMFRIPTELPCVTRTNCGEIMFYAEMHTRLKLMVEALALEYQ